MQVGDKVNEWTCLGYKETNKFKHRIYEFQCSCGRKRVTSLTNLRQSKQCRFCYYASKGGSLQSKFCYTYKSWEGMRLRCSNKNRRKYKDYGGRGIKICERWDKFENFLEDMGARPYGRCLDRINNDGNYEPSNCRWATPSESASNRRCSPRYSDKYYFGVVCRADLCSECRARLTI